MYRHSRSTLKCLCTGNSTWPAAITRTLFNPFSPKPIEKAKDAHSNALADTEHVFELQHHTVKPSAMVNILLR